jgi:hypothetical protein
MSSISDGFLCMDSGDMGAYNDIIQSSDEIGADNDESSGNHLAFAGGFADGAAARLVVAAQPQLPRPQLPKRIFGKGRHGDQMSRLFLSRHMHAALLRKRSSQDSHSQAIEVEHFADHVVNVDDARAKGCLVRRRGTTAGNHRDAASARLYQVKFVFRFKDGARTVVPAKMCTAAAFAPKLTYKAVAMLRNISERTVARIKLGIAAVYLFCHSLLLHALAVACG